MKVMVIQRTEERMAIAMLNSMPVNTQKIYEQCKYFWGVNQHILLTIEKLFVLEF